MSGKIVGIVFEHYPVGGGEMLVAVKLADNADHETGRLWPSVDTIARMTMQSDRTVQRHLQSMVRRNWLAVERKGGDGPGKTTVYRLRIRELAQQLVGKGDKLSPIELRVTPGAEKGDISGKKGDTAMSPEPSLDSTVREATDTGRALPSPVAASFRVYQDGIKARYGKDYPPSAKANGQLAQVVGRVGAKGAIAVVKAYLAHQEPFYAKTKHSLDFLVRDCEKIWLEIPAAGAAAPAPTTARIALLKDDGRVLRELDQVPAGNFEAIAKSAARSYATLIKNLKPKYLGVRQGEERRRFSIEELTA